MTMQHTLFDTPTWPDHVLAAYDAMRRAEERMVQLCRDGEISAAMDELERLPEMEVAVWRAWADATPEINPGLHRSIDSGLLRSLPRSTRDYLESLR